jgi:hypothetical protein
MNLNKYLKRALENYPTIFSDKLSTLMYLYCVIGNGVAWGADGEFEDRHSYKKEKIKIKVDLASMPEIKPTFIYSISKKHSLVASVPDNVKQDYLDGAFKVLELAASHESPTLTTRDGRPSEENREVALGIIKELEERFPGRVAKFEGRSNIPVSVEPYMFNSKQDLLEFTLGDKLQVTFGSGYRVPKKYAGKSMVFCVNNEREYTYRIRSKVLVLVSLANQKDRIVVHPEDRFECLMIDLFPCNRRPFAGWKNKEVILKKLT